MIGKKANLNGALHCIEGLHLAAWGERAIVDPALQRRCSCTIVLNEDFLRGMFKLFLYLRI